MPFRADPTKEYYEILGLKESASTEEIRKAYRKLALHYHPDRNRGDATAEERFKAISEAYAVLTDPDKRKLFDLSRATGAADPRRTRFRAALGVLQPGGYPQGSPAEPGGVGDLRGTDARVPAHGVSLRRRFRPSHVPRRSRRRFRWRFSSAAHSAAAEGSTPDGPVPSAVARPPGAVRWRTHRASPGTLRADWPCAFRHRQGRASGPGKWGPRRGPDPGFFDQSARGGRGRQEASARRPRWRDGRDPRDHPIGDPGGHHASSSGKGTQRQVRNAGRFVSADRPYGLRKTAVSYQLRKGLTAGQPALARPCLRLNADG